MESGSTQLRSSNDKLRAISFDIDKGSEMNPIIAMLKENNISDEQISEIFEVLTQNPLAAMATISQLGLPQEQLQALMGQVMQNPALIKEAVEELGLDFAKVEAAKEQLQK